MKFYSEQGRPKKSLSRSTDTSTRTPQSVFVFFTVSGMTETVIHKQKSNPLTSYVSTQLANQRLEAKFTFDRPGNAPIALRF